MIIYLVFYFKQNWNWLNVITIDNWCVLDRCSMVWFCVSGRIPRLSLNQHSLYIGVVEKPPPPPLIGEQYGKMEPKYPEVGHCQSVLRPQGVFSVPLYFK